MVTQKLNGGAKNAIISALMAALLTGAGAWMSFGRGTVSRAEMETYVETHMKLENKLLEANTEAIKALTASFNAFVKEQAEFNGMFKAYIAADSKGK